MKKHFTFGIAFLSVTAVFAQSRDEARNNRYGDYSQSKDIAPGRDATQGNVPRRQFNGADRKNILDCCDKMF